MRRLIIYLFIAVLTFAVGTLASMFLGGFLAPSVQKVNNAAVSISTAPAQETIVTTLQTGCACSQSRDETSGRAVSGSEQRASISGGILNGKALSLPKPSYPAIARAARASGTVTVQVVIDERGCVQSARTVGGHPLLQSTAAQAALQACFSPTLLSGQPVKVSGVITYNFVAQ
jgi:TonB family protein